MEESAAEHLVNTIRSAVNANISVQNLPVSSLNLPIEGGSIDAPGGQFTASFDSLGVHVYQWGSTPQIQ